MYDKNRMYYEAIKDYFLYIIPNFILLKVLKGKKRCSFYYEKIKSNENYKFTVNEFLKLVLALFVSLISLPVIAIILWIDIYLLKKVMLHRIEVSITTCCSLKCKSCSNLMQYYNNPYHIDYNLLIHSIDNLLEVIDSLENIVFLGGEPFLYPQLKPLLEYTVNQPKIRNVQVITNGIFHLDDSYIDLLRNDKVSVSVSCYGVRDEIVDATCRWLFRNKIAFVSILQMKWFDFGDVTYKGRRLDVVKGQYETCDFKCKCILNGKMYVCPRASHGTDLGFYTDNTYADLMIEDKKERKKQILQVYYCNHLIEACKYCDAGTEDSKEIICGEQR